jgi:Leu/Phe-tRNA-protein transferase
LLKTDRGLSDLSASVSFSGSEDVMIEELSRQELDQDLILRSPRTLYWSAQWSVDYYTAQAATGCIATATNHNGVPLLLPEVQASYAVLFHDDLHVTKKVRKRAKRYTLALGRRLEDVLAGIERSHESWVIERYRRLLLELRSMDVERTRGVRVRSVELLDAESNLVAGEVGYTVGAVYVSLTGYCDRANHPGAGSVQLAVLSRLLAESGYAFWSLGHPPRPAAEGKEACMMYKAHLGARVLERAQYLEMWSAATAREPRVDMEEYLAKRGNASAETFLQ